MCMCSQTQAYIGTSSPAHGGEAPEPKSASRIKFLITAHIPLRLIVYRYRACNICWGYFLGKLTDRLRLWGPIFHEVNVHVAKFLKPVRTNIKVARF